MLPGINRLSASRYNGDPKNNLDDKVLQMPQIKEASVALAGQIADIKAVTDFKTGEQTGFRILVMTPDGASNVKAKLSNMPSEQPEIGDVIVWNVRYGSFDVNGKSGLFCTFISEYSETDLEHLQNAVKFVSIDRRALAL